MSRKLDIPKGHKFGNLVVIREVKSRKGLRRFKLKCECGRIFETSLNHLRNGHTRSCGCLQNRDLTEANKVRWKNKKGYTICNGYLCTSDQQHNRVHVLIMEQLIGRKLLPNECVHHINENKLDNRPENLILMTKSQHMRYHIQKRRQEGTFCNKGEANPFAKLTEEDVRFIRKEYGKIRCKELSEMLGVKPNTICQIAFGKGWKHIEMPSITE